MTLKYLIIGLCFTYPSGLSESTVSTSHEVAHAHLPCHDGWQQKEAGRSDFRRLTKKCSVPGTADLGRQARVPIIGRNSRYVRFQEKRQGMPPQYGLILVRHCDPPLRPFRLTTAGVSCLVGRGGRMLVVEWGPHECQTSCLTVAPLTDKPALRLGLGW